jgi:chondroitin AC lyase
LTVDPVALPAQFFLCADALTSKGAAGETMSTQTEWISVGGISSDRSLAPGEQLQIVLLGPDGSVVEWLTFTPLPGELTQYRWPYALASHVNATGRQLRAGIKQADGTFKPEFSSYLNKIWTTDATRTVLNTACDLSQWADMGAINSTGSLPAGSFITCQLLDTGKGHLYQTVDYPVPDGKGGRFTWPAYLSRFINEKGGLLRSGEKDNASKTFVPISSAYRNHLWVPIGVPLQIERRVTISASARANAQLSYEALCAQVVKTPPPIETIDAWLTGFEGGRYQDLTYPAPGTPVADVTALATHLDRTAKIASYLYKQATPAACDYLLKAAEALNFYASQDYRPVNWWYRNIGFAKPAAIAGLLLARHLSQGALMDVYIPYAMRVTTTFAHTQTGANLADFASIQVIWSLCAWKNSTDDSYLLFLRGAADVLSELCLPVARNGKEHGEGISVDYSISQHNSLFDGRRYNQLYSGGYGTELLGRIFENLTALKGEFALSPTSQHHLIRVLVEGLGWMGYARHLDFHVYGRGISRGPMHITPFGKWATILLPAADDSSRPALEELVRRTDGDESGNRYYKGARVFWVNEYMAYVGTGFCLWARVVSTRTIGTESANGENPKALYMGAGTYLVSRHGLEYENIQPVWDWQRLPGSTVEQVPDFVWPDIYGGRNTWGSHDFAGGTSRANRSILSMQLSRRNVTDACKTVMAIDDRVLCMGTHINSLTATHPVTTTVNQCIARGAVRYKDFQGNEYVVEPEQSITSSNIHQVYHDGFVYSFGVLWLHPSVTIEVKTRTGSWSDINVGGSPAIIERLVFSLWVNHPQRENASYLFEVQPAEGLQRSVVQLRANRIAPDIHMWGDDTTLIGTFFTAGPGNDETRDGEPTIYPEQPCSFIYEREDTQFRLTCADPTQTLEHLSFVVAVDEQGVPTRRIEVSLPQGDERGRSVTGVYPLRE